MRRYFLSIAKQTSSERGADMKKNKLWSASAITIGAHK